MRMIMIIRMMMMRMGVGKYSRRTAEPDTSGTLNLPPTRIQHTAMMKIQMMRVMMMVRRVMRKVGGEPGKGEAASSGNTTPHIQLKLHSSTTFHTQTQWMICARVVERNSKFFKTKKVKR